jgi:hypothetical protein
LLHSISVEFSCSHVLPRCLSFQNGYFVSLASADGRVPNWTFPIRRVPL